MAKRQRFDTRAEGKRKSKAKNLAKKTSVPSKKKGTLEVKIKLMDLPNLVKTINTLEKRLAALENRALEELAHTPAR